MSAQKLTVLILYLLGLVGLLVIGNSFFSQLACEGQLLYFYTPPTAQQEIWGEQIIGQSFVAPHHQLNQVDIRFQTYGRRNTEEVTFRLLELPQGTTRLSEGLEQFQTTFNAAEVPDQSWRTFTFPPIANSAGKTYLVILNSANSKPGNALTVNGVEKDIYEPGTAFLGGAPVLADFTFRACFEMSAGEKWQVFMGQLTRYRPGWWGNESAYVIAWLIYGLLLGGFFWQLTRLALK